VPSLEIDYAPDDQLRAILYYNAKWEYGGFHLHDPIFFSVDYEKVGSPSPEIERAVRAFLRHCVSPYAAVVDYTSDVFVRLDDRDAYVEMQVSPAIQADANVKVTFPIRNEDGACVHPVAETVVDAIRACLPESKS
jgi:hypothetical protein